MHAAAIAAGAPPRAEEVSIPAAGRTLAGLLLAGRDPLPQPAVLVLPDEPCNDPWSRAFADSLAAGDLVVLLLEPRDCAEPAAGAPADREALAENALAALAWLAARPEADPGPIGLVGLGGGADLAAVVAAKAAERTAFVVAVDGGVAATDGFAPMSWWWTADAPLLFLLPGDDAAAAATARARIDEELVAEGIEVAVELFPDAALRGGGESPRPAAEVLSAVRSWRRRRL